jgi:hypothetical protein
MVEAYIWKICLYSIYREPASEVLKLMFNK